MSTAIAWTDETWNPIVGCTKVSAGCKNCYAYDLHEKRHRAYLAGKLQSCPQYARPFGEIQVLDRRLNDPIRWRKPRRIFVNSVSDLMHRDITDADVRRVLHVIAETPRHTYQLLTKRPERLADFAPYPAHCWIGSTVEDQAAADTRIPLLRTADAPIRFLSCEPLLEPVTLDLDGIHWVIVGGEKTLPMNRARVMALDWARDILAQCRAAGVPFFMKQATNESPIPDDLMIREWPRVAQEAAA